jgi:hypothetical protein
LAEGANINKVTCDKTQEFENIQNAKRNKVKSVLKVMSIK